jgi:lysophospholipase L1-like esterase
MIVDSCGDVKRTHFRSGVVLASATSIAFLVGAALGFLFAQTSDDASAPESMSAAALSELAPEVLAVLRPDQLRVGADLYFLGDSVVASMDLDEYFPTRDAANRGVGRNTTGNMQERLDTVLAAQPSCVVVMGGVNDLSFGTPVDWMAHPAITDESVSNGANVILVTTPQPAGGELAAFVSDVNRREMNDSIRALAVRDAGNVAIADFAAATDRMSQEEFRDLTTDGYHLNSAGYQLLAQTIDPLLDRCTDGND